MHETSLGGTLTDYLSGEARDRTTYEDLRQALARYLVEDKGYPRSSLTARFPVEYAVDGLKRSREADLAVGGRDGLRLMILFCPGQVHTFARESVAMARLALPVPSPLVVVTDMREAELISVRSGEVLARGMSSIPGPTELDALARDNEISGLQDDRRDKESRILHAYTGLLKDCCSAVCRLPE